MSTDSPEHYQVPLMMGGYTDVRLDLTLHFHGPSDTVLIAWTLTDSLTDETVGMGCDRPVQTHRGDVPITRAIGSLLQGVRAALQPF